MGYFSNGSEGEDYFARWCARCVHEKAERGCAVWDAHLLYNGEQEAVLNVLIPRTKDGLGNKQCLMFLGKKGQ